MILSFYARQGNILAWPHQNTSGRPRRYIGRDTVVTDAGIMHPAQKEPVRLDTESKNESEVKAAHRVMRLFRIESEMPLWPADQATASACGVKFKTVRFEDSINEFVESESPKKKGSEQ